MENRMLLCFINLSIIFHISQHCSSKNEGIENCEGKIMKFNDLYNLATYPYQIQDWWTNAGHICYITQVLIKIFIPYNCVSWYE